LWGHPEEGRRKCDSVVVKGVWCPDRGPEGLFGGGRTVHFQPVRKKDCACYGCSPGKRCRRIAISPPGGGTRPPSAATGKSTKKRAGSTVGKEKGRYWRVRGGIPILGPSQVVQPNGKKEEGDRVLMINTLTRGRPRPTRPTRKPEGKGVPTPLSPRLKEHEGQSHWFPSTFGGGHKKRKVALFFAGEALKPWGGVSSNSLSTVRTKVETLPAYSLFGGSDAPPYTQEKPRGYRSSL